MLFFKHNNKIFHIGDAVMKISTIAKLISGLFIVADQLQAQSEQRSSYNILFPNDQDLAILLKDMPQVFNANSMNKANIINLDATTQNVTTLELTDAEANNIAQLLQPYKGLVEPNFYYNTDSTVDNNTQFLEEVPNCNVPIYGEDIVIMGSKIYPSQPAFKKYAVSTIYDFYNSSACTTHETKVAEVVTKVINGGDIKFLNAVTADCTGKSWLFVIIDAINAAIKYKHHAGKNRRMTINLSSTGASSTILDVAFANAVKAGIRVVTAAGNFAKDANNYGPANLGCTIAETIGGTSEQRVYRLTNYGECVDVYLPACMQLRDPKRGIIDTACGTSFASPFEAARGLIHRFYYPQDTPEQTKFALKNHTVTIPVPTGSHFTGTMRVITADMTCPQNTNPYIFKGIIPMNGWLALAPPDLCVTFMARGKNSAISVKFIDSNSEICTLTIGRKRKNKNKKYFLHYLECNNTKLATKRTKYSIVDNKDQLYKISQKDNLLLVSFRHKNRDQEILSSASIGNRNAISFDKNGGRAVFKNALHCNI